MSKTNYYNKRVKKIPYSDANVIQQLRSTKALLKFCLEHKYPENNPALKSIELCAEALEKKDIKSAVEHYLDVPLGGNGCFKKRGFHRTAYALLRHPFMGNTTA